LVDEVVILPFLYIIVYPSIYTQTGAQYMIIYCPRVEAYNKIYS
jgi:hypothetical protein